MSMIPYAAQANIVTPAGAQPVPHALAAMLYIITVMAVAPMLQ
jgi:hypothetical protein